MNVLSSDDGDPFKDEEESDSADPFHDELDDVTEPRGASALAMHTAPAEDTGAQNSFLHEFGSAATFAGPPQGHTTILDRLVTLITEDADAVCVDLLPSFNMYVQRWQQEKHARLLRMVEQAREHRLHGPLQYARALRDSRHLLQAALSPSVQTNSVVWRLQRAPPVSLV